MPPYVLALAMEDTHTANNNAKTPDTETPPQSQPTKSISFSNGGTLKRHHHSPPHLQQPIVVFYKECLKNHAASLGGLALDGCGEFMPSPSSTNTDPTSLKCAACGCHRNFHRRELDEPPTHLINFHHHHQHSQLLPPPLNRSLTPSPASSPSPSPPPVPNSCYASAPHMLLALSTGFSGPSSDDYNHHQQPVNPAKSESNPSGRKRFRTKFSQTQKEKMHCFAEKLGWKMHKSDERLVEEFCNEVGVRRGVLKVWMHNNKHSIGKRDQNQIGNNNNPNNNEENGTHNHSNGNGNGFNVEEIGNGNGNSRASYDTDPYNNNTDNENHQNEGNSVNLHVSTNGSSSSS